MSLLFRSRLHDARHGVGVIVPILYPPHLTAGFHLRHRTNQMLIPVQWTAWLSHTRSQPPSLTELQSDFTRQSSLLNKIATIEAREKEERIRQGYSSIDAPEDIHSGTKFGLPGRIRAPPSFVPKSTGEAPPAGALASGEGE